MPRRTSRAWHRACRGVMARARCAGRPSGRLFPSSMSHSFPAPPIHLLARHPVLRRVAAVCASCLRASALLSPALGSLTVFPLSSPSLPLLEVLGRVLAPAAPLLSLQLLPHCLCTADSCCCTPPCFALAACLHAADAPVFLAHPSVPLALTMPFDYSVQQVPPLQLQLCMQAPPHRHRLLCQCPLLHLADGARSPLPERA